MATNLLDLVDFAVPADFGRRFADELCAIEDVTAAAQRLAASIRQQLHTAGSGTLYRAGGRVQRAAAPGSAPALQRGELANSILVRPLIQRRLRHRKRVRVGTREREAPALEFGFRKGGGGIAAHPFMRPGYEAVQGELVNVARVRLKARGTRAAKARERARGKRIRPGKRTH